MFLAGLFLFGRWWLENGSISLKRLFGGQNFLSFFVEISSFCLLAGWHNTSPMFINTVLILQHSTQHWTWILWGTVNQKGQESGASNNFFFFWNEMHLAKSQICTQTQSKTHMHGASVPQTTSTPNFLYLSFFTYVLINLLRENWCWSLFVLCSNSVNIMWPMSVLVLGISSYHYISSTVAVSLITYFHLLTVLL